MNKLCLFIHYDENHCYTEDDIKYINNLSKNFKTVTILTSNSNKIENYSFDCEIEYILNIPNFGYDFGKIQYFLREKDITNIECCYIFNNSCLLVRDLEPSISYMDSKNLDFWSYTTSLARAFHTQSYFMYFSNPALKEFISLLREKDPHGNKYGFEEVVNNLEIQILRHMNLKKFKCGSYLHTHKIFGDKDSTVFHADKLLVLNQYFPFIKKKVFTNFKTFDRKYLESLI